MAFKFLNLPFLAQKDVLKQLAYSELINISTCSSKLQSIGSNISFKDVTVIRIGMNGKIFEISVTARNGKMEKVFVMRAVNDFAEYLPTVVKVGNVTERVVSQRVDRTDNESEYFIHHYPIESKESIERNLYKHIIDLFGQSPSIQLQVRTNNPHFYSRGIENISETRFDGIDISVEESFLEEHFTRFPNQKSVSIAAKIAGEIKENSKIMQIPAVIFRNSDEQAASILNKFSGRHLALDRAKCEWNTLVQFLRKWVSNEAHHNLETFYIRLPVRSDNAIMEAVTINQWDPESLPPSYNYNPPIIDFRHAKVFNSMDLWHTHRESDGRRASVFFGIIDFYFFVWDSKYNVLNDNDN